MSRGTLHHEGDIVIGNTESKISTSIFTGIENCVERIAVPIVVADVTH
jgi:hypothetical protein